MRKIAISIDLVIQVTENHGGYVGGICLACGSSGFLDHPKGYPSSAKGSVMSNRLIHEEVCEMNRHLRKDGRLK